MTKTPEKVRKTDSNGNTILVDNPDLYNEFGQKIKLRNKLTNFTSKRKKRE